MPTCPDMSLGLARRMVTLTSAFYREQAASFSATRQSAWPGWEHLLELLPPDPPSLGVVDVACGNQRLGRFLEERLPHTRLSYVGVDNCRPLAGDAPLVEADVARTLLERPLHLGLPEADAAVSFGFMHHLPTSAARERLLSSLVAAVRPGGLAVVSLWRFMDSDPLAAKARATTARALGALGLAQGELGANDYLLGWQGKPGAYRFCHYVDDDEVRALTRAVPSAQPVGTFPADGHGGDLNTYLVLRRKGATSPNGKSVPPAQIMESFSHRGPKMGSS